MVKRRLKIPPKTKNQTKKQNKGHNSRKGQLGRRFIPRGQPRRERPLCGQLALLLVHGRQAYAGGTSLPSHTGLAPETRPTQTRIWPPAASVRPRSWGKRGSLLLRVPFIRIEQSSCILCLSYPARWHRIAWSTLPTALQCTMCYLCTVVLRPQSLYFSRMNNQRGHYKVRVLNVDG